MPTVEALDGEPDRARDWGAKCAAESEVIAESLRCNGHPFALPEPSKRFHVFDAVLLDEATTPPQEWRLFAGPPRRSRAPAQLLTPLVSALCLTVRSTELLMTDTAGVLMRQ